MAAPRTAPYGSWRSPITSDLIASGTIQLSQVVLDGDDTYWTEMRPAEGGRYVIVRRTADGTVEDVIPPPFNARTRVHEYGGGACTVSMGEVFFANFDDQRIYRVEPGGQPEPLTPAGPWRYADMLVERRRRLLLCVYEDHTDERNVVNSLAAVPLAGGPPRPLTSGYDFCSNPRLSPDGTLLAWLCWNHPDMPWDRTELLVSEHLDDGTLSHPTRIAGGAQADESIFQPEWGPDGRLYFVSDRSGWWTCTGFGKRKLSPFIRWKPSSARHSGCSAHPPTVS